LTVSSYNDFSGGMIVDPANGILPQNGVADAADCFFDVPSKVRSRNATFKPDSATSTTASAIALGVGGGSVEYHTNTELYGITTTGSVQFLNRTTGVATSMSGNFGTPSVIGRPVTFLGVALFPTYSGSVQSYIPAAFAANDSGHDSYSPAAGTVATVTADSSIVTFSAGAFTTLAQSGGGQFITIVDSGTSSTRNIYLGTFFPQNATTIKVDPIPTKSFTATQGTGTGAFVASVVGAFSQAANPNTVYSYGARCAAVHQNRVLLGGVARYNTSSGGVEEFPRSVFYSILPDAKAEQPSQNVNAQGHAWMFREAIELNNRFTIGGSDPILALAPVSDGELLIFTRSEAWRLSGYLTTRYTNDAGGVTYDVHPIPESPGLLAERSIQQTPHGLVFANKYDLYVYAGGKFTPLLGRANSLYWQSLLSNRVVLGSHMLNDDFYVISIGTDNAAGGGGGATVTLCYHLATRTLSRLTGNSLVLFNSAPDPASPVGRIGLRWWDSSGTAPSMTGSQLSYTSRVAAPIDGSTTDSDGHGIAQVLKTRVYDEGAPDQKKRFWRTVWRINGIPLIQVAKVENIFASSPSPVTIGTPAAIGLSSYTGPVLHTRGVQYTLTSSSPGFTFELFGFDHYYDPVAYAVAS
jgi:hypothetical protein